MHDLDGIDLSRLSSCMYMHIYFDNTNTCNILMYMNMYITLILVWSVCTGQYSSIGSLILQEAVLILLCLGLQRSHIDPLVEFLHTALQHRSGREDVHVQCILRTTTS